MSSITPGQVYLHKNGVKYVVMRLANVYVTSDKRDEYPLLVVYYNPLDPDKLWAKSPDGFLKNRTLVS
jgi:nucleoside-diphosphate-sugar epimerase